jgi:hypothetical protein
MRTTGKQVIGTTATVPTFTIDTKGAQGATIYLKNTGATALNACDLKKRVSGAPAARTIGTSAAWSNVAFTMANGAGNPTTLASGAEVELVVPATVLNGADTLEIYATVASSTTELTMFSSTDRF